MTVIAHGADFLIMIPLAIAIGVLVVNKIKERRSAGEGDQLNAGTDTRSRDGSER